MSLPPPTQNGWPMRPRQRLIWTDYRSWSTNANSPSGVARGGPLDADDDLLMRGHGTVVEQHQGATPVGETAVVMSETLSGAPSQAKGLWTLPTPHVRPDGTTVTTTMIPILGGVVGQGSAGGVIGSVADPVPASAASIPASSSYAVHSLGTTEPGTWFGLGGYRWTSSTAGWCMLNMEQQGLWWDIIGQVNGHAYLGDPNLPTSTRNHVRNAALGTSAWHASRLRQAFPEARVGNYGFPVLRPSNMQSPDPARAALLLWWTQPGEPFTAAESAWLDAQAALWAPACEPYNVLIPITRPFHWSTNGLMYDRGYRRAAIELAVRVRKLLGRDRKQLPIVPSTSLLFSDDGSDLVSQPFTGTTLRWVAAPDLSWVPEPAATSGDVRLMSFRRHVVGDAIDAGADGVWLTFGWDQTYQIAMTTGSHSTSVAFARYRMTRDHDLISRRGAPDVAAMMEDVRAAGASTWGSGSRSSEVAYRAWWEDSTNRALVAADVATDSLIRSGQAADEMLARSVKGMARRATIVALSGGGSLS